MEETSSLKGLQAEPADMPALSCRAGKGEEAELMAIWSASVCMLVPGTVGMAGPVLARAKLACHDWMASYC